ncbi:MAG: glycoside hydrolase family 3 N-terminal domain-containing protein [Anaerolineales bacterium]
MSPQPLPYLDPSLPFETRVEDLISRLSLPEKISQMLNECPAIPRLGIPAYNYWSEGLHGVVGNGRATVFPQAIGLAATWDANLLFRVATAISNEGRAKYHAALRRQGYTIQLQGLTFWAPNINIFRDPRWGRGQETYGEDPYLTGEMGVAFVRGMQGDDPKYLKTAACAKHFAVHSGPEGERHGFDARVSLRDLNDTYLPAFKKLVQEARVEAVMGAYNRVNGQAASASPFLLEETLRKKWGFQGHVVSDCWALTDIHTGHKLAADAVEAAALALKAGCDLSCGVTYDRLDEALARGLVSEAEIERALRRTLLTRFKLGIFDPPGLVPYADIPPSVIASPRHAQVARQAAQESIVLLKNRAGILPIRPEVRRISIVGPTATSIEALLGNYNGFNANLTTLMEGIVGRAPEGVRVGYRMGVPLAQASLNPLDWTTGDAAAADVAIACMGYTSLLESEEGDAILSEHKGDRADIGLPPAQVDFVKKLAASGARVVLVLCGGSPIALGELEEMVEAILFVWYPGQAGGQALADVLFGDVSPSGKLPLTFPRATADLPPFEDYRMEGRTYRYSTVEPLYPFGFGLSYTRFMFSDLKLKAERLQASEPLSFTFRLQNTGGMDADEVVQVYLKDLQASAPVPLHKLVAFRRVHLPAGQAKTLRFSLPPEALAFMNEAGEQVVEPGQFRLTVGSCSPGPRGLALGAPQPLEALFTLE